jgi:hypothetical protein
MRGTISLCTGVTSNRDWNGTAALQSLEKKIELISPFFKEKLVETAKEEIGSSYSSSLTVPQVTSLSH